MSEQQNIIGETDNARQQQNISEGVYQLLFNHIDEGCYICDVIFDEHSKVVDLYYIDANLAAIRMSGEDRRGKYLRNVGNYEEYGMYILGK